MPQFGPQIRGKQIKDESINADDIKDDSVRSEEIKDGTIKIVDLHQEVLDLISQGGTGGFPSVNLFSELPAGTPGLLYQVKFDEAPNFKGLYWFHEGTWNLLHEGPKTTPDSILLQAYNICNDASSQDDANNQIKAISGVQFSARPQRRECAEDLRVTSNANVSLGEIMLAHRNIAASEIIISYYAEHVFEFVMSIRKTDLTTTSLNEFTGNSHVAYTYNVIDKNGAEYEGECDFTFSGGTSRNWSNGADFSSDDGGWGMAPGELDFNSPGPYLDNYADNVWGFGNQNSNDNSARDLFINGAEVTNLDPLVGNVFINTNT